MRNLHLLQTEKPSKLHLAYNDYYYLSLEPFIQIDTRNYKSFNIYIISDEEIKEGDWVTNGVEIFKPLDLPEYTLEYANRYWEKIILTTDLDLINDGVQSIDDEFLTWFVKNPSCIYFEVKKIYLSNDGQWKEVLLPSEWEVDTKVKQSIIPKEETSVIDIEKIAMDKLKNKWAHLYTFGDPQKPFPTNYENDLNNIKVGLYEGIKHQKERSISMEAYEDSINMQTCSNFGYESKITELKSEIKTMYSKEEVLDIVEDFNASTADEKYSIKEWFKNYKK